MKKNRKRTKEDEYTQQRKEHLTDYLQITLHITYMARSPQHSTQILQSGISKAI